MVTLIENTEGITDLRSLCEWTNTHCVKCSIRNRRQCDPRDSSTTTCRRHGTRKPIQGERLARAMSTMTKRYGVQFMFCTPDEAARIVCELLGVKYDNIDRQ